jgi:hypothetical protein
MDQTSAAHGPKLSHRDLPLPTALFAKVLVVRMPGPKRHDKESAGRCTQLMEPPTQQQVS